MKPNPTCFLGGGQLKCFFGIFTPKIGEDEPILAQNFSNGLVKHHNQNLFLWDESMILRFQDVHHHGIPMIFRYT